jgi:methionyl-tRNA formyltransferase
MKFLFVGNRKFVLEEMINLNLDLVNVLVVENSHLHTEINKLTNNYKLISNKNQLIKLIEKTNFDVLVANGCPFILPVKKLKEAKYVNIHPSYLPDLRGVDPVVGSILYQRDSGATCHIIDEGIDTGNIISRVKIPYSSDIDVALLYQLSFIAEKEVFYNAYKKGFKEFCKQENNIDNLIYYKRNKDDQTILISDSPKQIINKTKAFGNISQGVNIVCGGICFKAHEAQVIENSYLHNYAKNFKDNIVFMSFEESILFKRNDKIIRISNIKLDDKKIPTGATLN